ncbi:TPR repeat-containing protein [Rippkaea orientalis PCC 8801]|uniref:TPR repeat-containing protein n=1 Tax=Rippkaea orientalis (strain PCC 8801 / RF-1) TaxID=41431 RepID=B7K271_RIPO1|nr:tetratricopeptide repeat protein [Rippkaea orientalis]ACK65207.1 TPR repeat-containing protein [Rippkaea orientalis PCC 8801]
MNNEMLPVVYLSGIVVFLTGLTIFILFQIIKTRRIETRFSKLQDKLQKEQGTAQDYYELGSLYLDKKLFVQAIKLLEKALKASKKVEPQNQALIYNALGYAYFSQEQLDVAIRHYKDAIKLYPEYAIALNNLANAYEKKQMINQAVETYEQTLKYEPNNKVAKARSEALRKRLVESK